MQGLVDSSGFTKYDPRIAGEHIGKLPGNGGSRFYRLAPGRQIVKTGKKVIVVDNFDEYYEPRIKRDNIAPHLNNRNFTLEEVDLRDKQGLEEIFQSDAISRVIHLAARAGVRASLSNPFIYEEVNIRGTLNLLEVCRRHDLESLCFYFFLFSLWGYR